MPGSQGRAGRRETQRAQPGSSTVLRAGFSTSGHSLPRGEDAGGRRLKTGQGRAGHVGEGHTGRKDQTLTRATWPSWCREDRAAGAEVTAWPGGGEGAGLQAAQRATARGFSDGGRGPSSRAAGRERTPVPADGAVSSDPLRELGHFWKVPSSKGLKKSGSPRGSRLPLCGALTQTQVSRRGRAGRLVSA